MIKFLFPCITLILSLNVLAVEIGPSHKKPQLEETEEKCYTTTLKTPSPKDHYDKWTALLEKCFDPLWLSKPVHRIITEYIDPPRTWKITSQTPLPPSTACAYIPQTNVGPLLAIGNAATHDIQLLTHDYGREVARLGGHSGDIRQLFYSLHHTMLVSNSDDGSVRLWRIRENEVKESHHFETCSFPGNISLSPDGKLLAAKMTSIRTYAPALEERIDRALRF